MTADPVILHIGPGDGDPLLGLPGVAHRPVYPDALDDVQAAYERCRGPVVVAGERLGGALAAALLVRLRDAGAPQPKGAVLVSPLLDLTLEAPSLALNARADPAYGRAALRERAARYAGATPRTDPLLSPLYANLHGLPPLRLIVAGTDPLLDDALAFAARAARSGVPVDLRVRRDGAELRRFARDDLSGFLTEEPRRIA